MAEKIDDTDREILKILQRDASLSLESIADIVGMSLNTCWRRVQRLEEQGIINKRVALLNATKLGPTQTVFVMVRTNRHTMDWAQNFAQAVESLPEIVEFYRLAGDVDYLLKIIARDVSDYDRIYRQLIKKVDLTDVSASFAMETIKLTTEVPL